MTITNQAATATVECDGVNSNYAFGFLIPYQADGVTPAIKVYSVDPDFNQVELNPNTYVVNGVGVSSGGYVHWIVKPSGWAVVIDRDLAYTQPFAFMNQSFYPKSVETDSDALEMQIQQLNRDLLRLKNGGGPNTFLGLFDTPDSYAGQGGKLVTVKPGEDGLQFSQPGAGSPFDATFEFLGGTPPLSNETMGQLTFTESVTFPGNFVGSKGFCWANPLATFIASIQDHTAAQVGTMTVNTDGSFVFTTTGGNPLTMAAGETLRVKGASVADLQLANLSFTLKGTLS